MTVPADEGLDATASPKARRRNHLVVVGLGYVGLPLAQAALASGIRVTGLDLSDEVVEGLNGGHSHVDDISDAELVDMLAAGFTASTETRVIESADVVTICVPTPLSQDGRPDLSAVLSSATSIAKHLRRDTLVVLESTTYPGTTEDEVQPVLETSGLRVGREFALAFSPERVDPGNKTFNIRNTPKVVGGVTDECTQSAAEFYGLFVDSVVRARSTREAETAKLLENTYRHINIALVNEMAKVCHELSIDLWNVIECAATKPFGFQPFYPGPGVGGHCIPIDPNYLSFAVKSQLGYPLRFVELAQEINLTMPRYVAQRVQSMLNDVGLAVRGSRILLVGVTYKADVADQRESPSDSVASHLSSMGADLAYHDPFVAEWAPLDNAIRRVVALDEVSTFDAVVFLQHHSAVESGRLVDLAERVLDTRGILRGTNVECL